MKLLDELRRELIKVTTFSKMNRIMNAFLSEYYTNLEFIYCISKGELNREEITKVMDEVLLEKRQMWERDCLKECQNEIKERVEKIRKDFDEFSRR